MNDRQLDTVSEENNYLDTKKNFKSLMKAFLKERHDFIVINYSNSRREGLYLNSSFEKIA